MNVPQKFASVINAVFMTCRKACYAQSESMDQDLPVPRRLGLMLHLLVCPWCRRYARQIRFLHDASKKLEKISETGPRGLSDDARRRIKRRLIENT
jgi:hypothetical protein